MNLQMTLFGEEIKNKKKDNNTDYLLRQKFGELKVISFNSKKQNGIYWNCKCSCGNLCTVRELYLKEGVKTNCGGLKHRKKKKETWAIRAIGKKFNKLTVLEYIGKNKFGKFLFNCKCDCGQLTTANISELTTGGIKSCGCLGVDARGELSKKFTIDITGQKFGMLTAIKRTGVTRSGDIRWLFKCDCGNEKDIIGRSVRTGLTTNCGCVVKKRKITKEIKLKRKPINREELAKDLYCFYLDGMNLKMIAIKNGWASGTVISDLFKKYIKEHKIIKKHKGTGQPVKKTNLGYKSESDYITTSKKFKKEAELQKICAKKIREKEKIYQHDMSTGYEIDIKTNKNCFELKNNTSKQTMYTALGQLMFGSILTNLKPILLIPSDLEMTGKMVQVFNKCGVKIKTEKDL